MAGETMMRNAALEWAKHYGYLRLTESRRVTGSEACVCGHRMERHDDHAGWLLGCAECACVAFDPGPVAR